MSVSIPSRPGGRQRNRIQLLPPLEGRMLPVCCNASSPMLMELIYALNLVYLTTLPGTCESQPWVLSWWRLPWRFSWDHGLTNWTNNGPTHTHTHTHTHGLEAHPNLLQWNDHYMYHSECANMRIHIHAYTHIHCWHKHTPHTHHTAHTPPTHHTYNPWNRHAYPLINSAPQPLSFLTPVRAVKY